MMRRHATRGAAAHVLVVVTLAAAVSGCRERIARRPTVCLPEPANPEPWSDGTCSTHFCVQFPPRILGQAPSGAKGAAVEFNDYGEFCRMDATWTVGTGGGSVLEVTTGVRTGVVLPLPEGPVGVHYCYQTTLASDGHWWPSQAGLVLDPDGESVPALGPRNGIIPFGGESRLDGDVRATVHLANDEPLGVSLLLDSAFVSAPGAGGAAFYPSLHEGDTFPWGRSTARIVRIVRPFSRVLGWVEVALSARSAAQRPAPPPVTRLERGTG